MQFAWCCTGAAALLLAGMEVCVSCPFVPSTWCHYAATVDERGRWMLWPGPAFASHWPPHTIQWYAHAPINTNTQAPRPASYF